MARELLWDKDFPRGERRGGGSWAGGSSSISQACGENEGGGGQTHSFASRDKADGLAALRLCLEPADSFVSLLKM